MRASVPEPKAVPQPEAVPEPKAVPEPPAVPEPKATEVRLTRRERRAAARGAVPHAKIPVRAGAKPPPPPVRHRDYASRKHG